MHMHKIKLATNEVNELDNELLIATLSGAKNISPENISLHTYTDKIIRF